MLLTCIEHLVSTYYDHYCYLLVLPTPFLSTASSAAAERSGFQKRMPERAAAIVRVRVVDTSGGLVGDDRIIQTGDT